MFHIAAVKYLFGSIQSKTCRTCFVVFLSALIFQFPGISHGKVLLEDTVWEGEILVEEDIVVPKGITLVVRKNTIVKVSPSDSTKTDPEFMSPLAEITVRGNFVTEGVAQEPVVFRLEPQTEEGGLWSGFIVDGGSVKMKFTTIQNAETAIWVVEGEVDLQHSTLTYNRYALVAQTEKSRVEISDSSVTGNSYGLMTLDGAQITRKNSKIIGNDKLEFHSRPADDPTLQLNSYKPVHYGNPKEIEDEVLARDTVWEGHIVINGRVRVPPESRLIIMPGTVIEFRKKDTNGDGIGENGLMLQGVLIAKGTPEKPIIFRSAEKIGNKGDWDAVNIISSDGVRNIIEYCQIEDAYRGLHFHFSNVAIQHSIFRNNYRGVQFQESTVELRSNSFYANHSAIQARDSEIIFVRNQVLENIFGANFLRAHLSIQDNRFGNNLDFGLKVREGFPTVTENVFHHNRFGLMFSDMSYGRTSRNLMLQNGEAGLSIRTGSNMEITGNYIQGNGLSGIAARNTLAVIKGNHITGNGERGIGLISFQGPISGNTILDNNLYAIAAEDEADVTATSNWYGQADIEPIIFDSNDDSSRGTVKYDPVLDEPPVFEWPLETVPVSLKWFGTIQVPEDITVPSNTTLTVKPGATVKFAGNTGMHVHGRFLALGKPDNRITFTSAEGDVPGSWGEIQIENASRSKISNSDFEYASWGIHCHFTPLKVIGSSFRNNNGGIRFRSGPLYIKNSLFSDNGIGIRSYRGKAEIIGNIITRNDKGIFVREKGDGLFITKNNIFANTDYNIWVGDFNLEDIQAPENWWGTEDPAETFFDARREPGIGTVLFEPQLSEQQDIEIMDKRVR